MRLLSVLLVGLVLGCAGDLERSVAPAAVVEEDSGVPRAKTRAEEEARAALAERGISFRVSEFLDAAAVGDLSVVELFVEGGMPVDAAFGGWTALHEAARNGHLLVVQYLIDQGASFGMETDSDRTALDLARRGGHGDVVVYMTRAARAALDSLGIAYTADAFVDSAGSGNLAVVKLFVEAGMSVNARDEDGDTALHVAARRGHLEVVEYLVGAGAYVRAANWSGRTALHVAAAFEHLEVLEFLVGAGADVNATDKRGRTALHDAALWGRLAVVEFLVGAGADMDARDNEYGRTALHFAASGDLAVVRYLVDRGADVDARDDDGDTPRDVAVACSTDTYYSDELKARCAAVVEYFDSLDDDE